MPELVIREGRAVNELVSFIKEDRAISILILAAGIGKEGPGPLVARVAGPVGRALSDSGHHGAGRAHRRPGGRADQAYRAVFLTGLVPGISMASGSEAVAMVNPQE